MFYSKKERKNHYSIRKYSVGVASVMIASFFLGGVAHAEAVPNGPVPNVTTEERRVEFPTMEQSTTSVEDKKENHLHSDMGEVYPELKAESGEPSNLEIKPVARISRDTESAAQEKVTAEQKEEMKDEKNEHISSRLTEEQLKQYREGLKAELDKTDLSPEKKAEYRKKIDQETDYDNLLKVENDYNDENRKLNDQKREEEQRQVPKSHETDHSQTNQDTAVPETLEKIDQELDYQKAKIEKMSEQKGITAEEKEVFLKNIEAIRKKAYQDAKGKDRNTIEAVKQEVIQQLSKTPQLYKSYLEKEIQDYVNKLIEAKDLNEAEVSENEEVKALLAQEKEAFEKLDKARTNAEALQAKNEFFEKISKETSTKEIEKVETPTPSRTKRALESTSEEHTEDFKRLQGEAKVEVDKLQSLVKQGLEEIKKLEKHLEEVKQYPELKNTPDYQSQTGIWNDSKVVAPKKVESFKELIRKMDSKDYTEKKLKDFVDDFIYYQIHAQIEAISRQVATYREKYSNVAEIEKLFVDKVKQTDSNTYATLEGEALKKYFNEDILPAFKKIQEIVAGLEKKENPSEDSQKEPAAPTPPTSSETPKMEGNHPSQPDKSAPTVDDKKAEKPQSAKPAIPSKPQETDKATDLAKLKTSVQNALKKLEMEEQTVPDGAKLIGEAEKVFKEARSKATKVLEETKTLLADSSVTAEQLATQLSKVNDTLSELKEAKDKLVPKTPSIPDAPKKEESKPSTPSPAPKEKDNQTPKPNGEQKPKPEGEQTEKPSTPPKESPSDKGHSNQAGKATPSTPAPKEKDNQVPKPNGEQKPKSEGKQTEKELKPKAESSKKKNQTIFHANTGQHHITVAFDKAIEADKVDFKEVTSQTIVDTVIKKTGEGKVQLFDISLSKDGQKADVDGERLVRLAVDQVGADVQVYHVKENGELELIPSTIVDGQIVFKTKHFSLFAVKSVAQSKEKQMLGKTSSPTGTQHTGMEQMADKGSMEMKSKMSTKASKHQTEKPFTKTSKAKAVLPNTGTASSIVLTLIGLFTLVGALVLTKKVKKDDESL